MSWRVRMTFLQTQKDTKDYRFLCEISSIRSSPPLLLATRVPCSLCYHSRDSSHNP